MEKAKDPIFQRMPEETALGRHLIADLWGQDPQLLDDIEHLRESLKVAAGQGKFSVLGIEMHKFSPYGATGIVLLAESHITIHTWPEYCYAAIDIFACNGDPWATLKELEVRLRSKQVEIHTLNRGVIKR